MTNVSLDSLDYDVLEIDAADAAAQIARGFADAVAGFRRRGAVIALSGGVDSSVCAALAVQALGADKIFGLLLPERESSNDSRRLGRMVAEQLGIEYQVQDIGGPLEAIGCYAWRDEAIKRVFPAYGDDWKSKIAIEGTLQGQFNHFSLVVQSPDGQQQRARLSHKEYLQIVAATNYKQRVRKTVEYFHADRLNYVVIGTPNRLEYDQGFFVKNGDGSADVKPIAHLYKTQVYALARHFSLPDEVCTATPTTDTYSMPQGQDGFYFALPYRQMDLALWAYNEALPPEALAAALDVDAVQAKRIYQDIAAKRRATRYLHDRPVLLASVQGVPG
jgi:NAD+ synthase